MDSTRAPDKKRERSEGGIALFMVLSAVAALSLLVTEFTYISQLNQKIAFDALDQVKAHYLAKSALKLSLLRLKAYQQVKGFVGKGGGGEGLGAAIPRAVLDKIWSFPFIYPFPSNIPGMTGSEKDKITEFQKDSSLEGSFSAVIESESGKYNLNMLLAPYAPTPSPSPGAPSGQTAANPANPNPAANTSPPPSFDPNAAQKSLGDYLSQLLANKFETDQDFADEYRDLKMEDLTNNIRAWVDPLFERPYVPPHEMVALKKMPFSSLSELHMISGMTDELYDLFSPALTVSATPGINVNTMNEATLRALIPGVTVDESKDFFEFRDSEVQDNSFKKAADFIAYAAEHFAVLKGVNPDQFNGDLQKRNIRLVTDETQFKITVQAKVNESVRLIEAWVTLLDQQNAPTPPPQGTQPAPTVIGAPTATPVGNSDRNTGLKITFMRIL